MDGFLGGADSARRLHAYRAARLPLEVAYGLEHHERHGKRRGRGYLAGGSLHEIGAGSHRQHGGAPNVVVRLELARLEDHLQVGGITRILDLDDLLENRQVIAAQEGAPVDHHIDLVGACSNRFPGFRHLQVAERLARRKARRDRCNLDA